MSDIRVLLVEDNADTGSALSMLLQQQGYRVRWTRTAAETVLLMQSIARKRKADLAPEVVVLDLMLPDATGPELIDQLKAIGEVPPVIVHSAAAEWVLKAAAEQVQAFATLRKPVEGATLVQAIEAAAASRAASVRTA